MQLSVIPRTLFFVGVVLLLNGEYIQGILSSADVAGYAKYDG